MILNQNGNFTTVSQENFTIVELVKKLQAIYPKFKNDNLIVLLSSLKTIVLNEVI